MMTWADFQRSIFICVCLILSICSNLTGSLQTKSSIRDNGRHAIHAESEFACVTASGNESSFQCSTLVASCHENEKILVDKLHYGIRNKRISCSKDQTNCKIFQEGCCASSGDGDIYPMSVYESSPILKLCHGQRNCSFQPSLLDLQTLQSGDFLLFEYFCVNDSDIIDLNIHDEIGTAEMNQKKINLIYTPRNDCRTYERKGFIFDFDPSTENSSIEVILVRLRLLGQNNNCTSTRLKITDNILLLCGVFIGQTLQPKGPFHIELNISDSHPPDEIWISVEALEGGMKMNYTSRLYPTKNETEPRQGTTESIDCPKWEQSSLTVLIAVSATVLGALFAVLTALLVIRKRFRVHTESKPRREINSFDSRFYYTVEPHELQVHVNNSEHNSTLSNRNVDTHKNTLTAFDRVQCSNEMDMTAADHNTPAVFFYETISLTEDNMIGPNASCTCKQSVGVFQQTEIVDIAPKAGLKTDTDEENIRSEKYPVGKTGKKETIRTAGYDTITFSKPPRYKSPNYDSINGTFSPVTEHI